MKEFIKANWKVILIATFLLISLILGNRLINSNNRLIIYNDSIQVLHNKAGELYSRVNYYQITEKELKKVNSELYNEVKKLKDKPISIETVTTKTELKDIKLNKLNNTLSIDSTFSKGNSIGLVIKDDSLKQLSIMTKLYLSQTERKGKLYLNARSDFPNLIFTDIEGYNLNPLPVKKKRFGIGVMIGVNYNGKICVGAGFSYNLIRF